MTFGPLLLLPNETELMSFGSFVVAVLVQLLPCPLFINLTEPSNKKKESTCSSMYYCCKTPSKIVSFVSYVIFPLLSFCRLPI